MDVWVKQRKFRSFRLCSFRVEGHLVKVGGGHLVKMGVNLNTIRQVWSERML